MILIMRGDNTSLRSSARRAPELRFRGLTFLQERFPVSCLNIALGGA